MPTNSRTERFPIPQSYLEQRGADVARDIIASATTAADLLRRPGALDPPQLNADERRRGLKAASVLLPLAKRDSPGAVLTLSLLIGRWTKVTSAIRRGRRAGTNALFASVMLNWAAEVLGARGLPQLRAMELIAAAAAAGLPNVSWADRGELLDSWRKLRRTHLPKQPEELVKKGLSRLTLARVRALRALKFPARKGSPSEPE